MRSTGLVATAIVGIVVASGLAAGADRVDYVRDVKPLLAKHCLACHSPLRQKSGFRVDAAQLLVKGGDSGPAVVPGRGRESLLIHAVSGTGNASIMPPEGNGERLNAEQIDLLRRWIDEGALAPAETPAGDPRQHWAFQPVRRPDVPHVDDAHWSRHPIDAFVAARHARLGLKPRPEAERHVLLRRVHLDLSGLPPTRAELHAFLADESPNAYERVVDRLLASPRYGERWGRHWMDVWRYSDWAGWGTQVRDSQPHIWHWRDWIVESLNADRPYDEMVVDMLAADEVAPTDRDRLRATGFLVRNFKLLSREQWLQDTVEHTAKAFLGLTLNCARCHDHMTDPIDQEEYYRFRAVFEPHHVRTDRLPGTADVAVDGLPRVFDKDPAAATQFFIRGDERTPEKDRVITPGVLASLGNVPFELAEVELPRAAWDPLRQDFVIRDDLAAGERAVAAAKKKLDDLRAKMPPEPAAVAGAEREFAVAQAKQAALVAVTTVERLEFGGDATGDAWSAAARAATVAQRRLAVAEAVRDAETARLERTAAVAALEAARGAAKASGKEPMLVPLEAKLAAADKKLTDVEAKRSAAETAAAMEPTTAYIKRTVAVHPPKSTGRRTALARWIVDPRNPLTARVAANHLWARHFGTGLVPTTFNFGLSGEHPVDQALLDWLAAELVDPRHGREGTRPWTMKSLHRLIVTSRTYRLASTDDAANSRIDPDDRHLWRAPTRRMEAEAIRDSVLFVAGRLDPTMGGPDLDHLQGLTSRRRSLYFRHAAEKQMPFLKLFDGAGVGECYERRDSVAPQQALALANSELTLVQARLLARALDGESASDPPVFVAAAVEQVLSRPPTDAETATCLEFLAEQERFFAANVPRLSIATKDPDDGTKPSADPRLRARERLVHALLNHNDFVTIR